MEREYKIAKCGLTTWSKCRTRNTNLKECETCALVKRKNDNWKMIDRKPHKKCNRCGKFLPLDKFYKKTIHSRNGKTYESTEWTCKICRSEVERAKYRAKRKGNRIAI